MEATAAADFFSHFRTERQDISRLIQSLDAGSQIALSQQCDAILQRISELEKRVTAAIIFLPTYDQQSYALQLKELSDQLNTRRNQLSPREKFSFKSKRHRRKDREEEKVIPNTEKESSKSITQETKLDASFLISNLTHQYVHISPPSSAAPTDCALVNLTDCIVNLLSTRLSALHIRSLRRCVVISSPVSSSVLVSECEECVMILACHQFRMHNSWRVDVRLHVNSQPIIEDCQRVRFGRYCIKDTSRLFEESGLDSTPNQLYTQVRDFKWLRRDPSPNWSLIEENEDHERILDISHREIKALNYDEALLEMLKTLD
ncbi:uncharacterized protein VTP21DRAFT_8930 [Calcarisporiella thermophila]|uniref:uncharacterized protein n=1 Tax=Calcarisporiella thermophila TaxID=911321 RepID=UPI0037440D1A